MSYLKKKKENFLDTLIQHDFDVVLAVDGVCPVSKNATKRQRINDRIRRLRQFEGLRQDFLDDSQSNIARVASNHVVMEHWPLPMLAWKH